MKLNWVGDAALEGEPPRVSVVITTRGRANMMVASARSVFASTLREIELLVVDQSDDDETEAALASAFRWEPRLRYVRDDGRGSARGRNTGLRLARGEIVAITDDDCLVPEDWAADIVDLFERLSDVDLVFGQVDAPPHDYTEFMVPVALWKRRRKERGLGWKSVRLQGISANMAARRRLFEAIGGFDERFGVGGPRWCSEDFELHYRALVHGFGVLVEPKLVILHLGMRRIADAWELWRRDALGNGALTAHIVRRGHPAAALRFWWWNVGRVGLNAILRVVCFRRPTGLRLTVWMMRHSLAGFVAEWREPGREPAPSVSGAGVADTVGERRVADTAGGVR